MSLFRDESCIRLIVRLKHDEVVIDFENLSGVRHRPIAHVVDPNASGSALQLEMPESAAETPTRSSSKTSCILCLRFLAAVLSLEKKSPKSACYSFVVRWRGISWNMSSNVFRASSLFTSLVAGERSSSISRSS
jgi:hypothetical protein